MLIGYISSIPIIGQQEKLLKEGHCLNLWFTENEDISDTTGLSKKYPGQIINYNGNLEDLFKDSNFIVSDWFDPRYRIHTLLRLAKKYNKCIVGANDDSFVKLESDRFFAKKVAVKYLGLNPVETKKFINKEEFISYIKKCKHLVVAKVVNDTFETGTIPTFIPTSNDELITMARTDSFEMFKTGGVVTEPYHNDAYEVCIGGFFNGNSFNNLCMINQEYKGAVEGDIGRILTGEVGTVSLLREINTLPFKFRTIMNNFENFLKNYPFRHNKASKYRGFIDVNLMITKDKIYLLEFTTRQGIPTELEILNMVDSYGDFLGWQSGFLKKVPISNFDTNVLYVSSCLYSYSYPLELPDHITSIKPKVYGLNKLKNGYILLYATYNDKGEVSHGLYDRILLVHGKDKNIQLARSECISELSKINSWYCVYRKDIGYKWIDVDNLF